MAATPSKRKLNLSSDSETETPVAKRVHECLSDTSATSDQSDRLVIDLSYEAPLSPVDGPVTSTPARSESDWAEVARKGVRSRSSSKPENQVAEPAWFMVTLMTVAAAFPWGKATAIASGFMEHVGSNFIKQEGKGKNCLYFKIRADRPNHSNNFTFGKYTFRIRINTSKQNQEKQKISRGIIDIPTGQTFESVKKNMKETQISNTYLKAITADLFWQPSIYQLHQ